MNDIDICDNCQKLIYRNGRFLEIFYICEACKMQLCADCASEQNKCPKCQKEILI